MATHSLSSLPKSAVFTANLPADAAFPTPKDSHSAPRATLGPRMVREALYTYVRPDPKGESELLAVSDRALKDLNLSPDEATSPEFAEIVAGRKILWDEDRPDEGIYPWAQCYGGYQFGQWAGQLGDGRAISLFETTNPDGVRYELQLKGAGRTPYSRFADGRAVLRSSIREFVVSEYLNAIGIPTTRALSLTLNNGSDAAVIRERLEPGAIVARFAQSWIRFGTFDLPRMRGDRATLRTLADYTAEHVYGGWDKLPGALSSEETTETPPTNVPKTEIQGEGPIAQNRYARLYRAIARANALTVAKWQAYGFMNGVLNTDNTSVLGLSIDFGPFAFLDAFDPAYTPNHDDHMLRYAYRNQPTIIWWNLVRLGEALGELMGAGPDVDEEAFIKASPEDDKELIARAESLITSAGAEYKSVFLGEYKRLMTARLGLKTQQDSDFESLFSELLDALEAAEADFHHAFRRLSHIKIADLETEDQRKGVASIFFRKESPPSDAHRTRFASWLAAWAARVRADWADDADGPRIAQMLAVNPNFVPRGWILDDVIQRVERKGDRKVLGSVMRAVADPFQEDTPEGVDEWESWVGDVPKYRGGLMCSCSS